MGMAGSPPDPLCCHFALAKDLAEKKMDPGVRARDKLLLDVVEDKQKEIFKEMHGLAETDKERKILRSVLRLVRIEVENICKSRNIHGFWRLEILTKNSGIIGGTFRVEDTMFCFLLDKKRKKQSQLTITLEELKKVKGPRKDPKKENPIFCHFMETGWRGRACGRTAPDYCFTFPLRCAACLDGAKEPRCSKSDVSVLTIFRLFAEPWKLDISQICWSHHHFYHDYNFHKVLYK